MRFLIVNVHSARNLGDDAIMQATLDGLRTAFPEAQVTVAANDPHSWQRYRSIQVVGSLASWVADPARGEWRKRGYLMPITLLLLVGAAFLYRVFGLRPVWGTLDQQELLRSYYDADLVLSCGGGNFYAHRVLSPAFIWALVSLGFALALRKPVVMLPQSFGPIVGSVQRLLARWTFSRVRLIMAREPRALAFVRETLQVKAPVVLVPDMAFALAVETLQPVAIVSLPVRRIGVTAIDRSAQDPNFAGQIRYEGTLVTLLTRLASQYNAHICFFCQSYGPSPDQDDQHIARRLFEELRQNGVDVILRTDFRNAHEIIAAYSQLDMVIGTRMHTGIFALAAGVPVLLIGYQPKACGMMATLGLERYCCDIEQVDADRLYEMACEIFATEPELRFQIRERLAEVRNRSDEWLSYLKEVLCDASA